MSLILIRTEGIVSHIDTVGIDVELCARRGILHIISAVMFRQPRPLDIAAEHRIGVIFSEAFPSVSVGIKIEQFHRLAFGYKAMIFVKSDSTDRIDV